MQPHLRWSIAVAMTVAFILQAPAVSAQRASDEVQQIEEAVEVLRDLTAQPDEGIPQYLLQRAEAIVVIPDMIRGGFVLGAKHGEGVVSVRDRARNEWSSPAFVEMTGGSVGWQIGAQSVDLVLLVMNQNGVRRLLENRFTLGGELSVVAGPVGRTANAATDLALEGQILAYSRAKGFFLGATLEGVSLRADDDGNEAFYGRELSLRQIAVGAEPTVRAPLVVTQWSDALRSITGSSPQSAGADFRPGLRRDAATAAGGNEAISISLSDPLNRYIGQRVTITASVEDLYSRTLFSVDDDVRQSTGRELIVLDPRPLRPLEGGGAVTVVGTIHEFDADDIEDRLTEWRWDVSDDVLRGFRGRPVLIAESVRMSDDATATSAMPPLTPPTAYRGTVARIEDLVANADDYYGREVMVSAEVEDVYSRTVFALDDDKLLSTGREVLVVAPTIRRPVTGTMSLIIVGEVMEFDEDDVEDRFTNYEIDLPDDLIDRFDDRPVILATSIRTAEGEELIGVTIPARR